jgi:hypothetical protein
MAIRDINNSAPDEHWMAKVSLLYDVISHHINEEEKRCVPRRAKSVDGYSGDAVRQRIQNKNL